MAKPKEVECLCHNPLKMGHISPIVSSPICAYVKQNSEKKRRERVIWLEKLLFLERDCVLSQKSVRFLILADKG